MTYCDYSFDRPFEHGLDLDGKLNVEIQPTWVRTKLGTIQLYRGSGFVNQQCKTRSSAAEIYSSISLGATMV